MSILGLAANLANFQTVREFHLAFSETVLDFLTTYPASDLLEALSPLRLSALSIGQNIEAFRLPLGKTLRAPAFSVEHDGHGPLGTDQTSNLGQ